MGVFLIMYFVYRYVTSLPHVRGGVSVLGMQKINAVKSSPRAWGCFSLFFNLCPSGWVFPTCVGVFPLRRPDILARRESSPRAWGCFLKIISFWGLPRVFPTCVGVFPRLSTK